MKSSTSRLIQVLKAAISVLGLTQKEVESRLGLSPGYLSRLFGGQIDLKADHVAQIAEVLEVDPEEIFRLAFPPTQDRISPKTQRLRDGLGARTTEPAPPPNLSWMEQEIERIVKRALAENRGS